MTKAVAKKQETELTISQEDMAAWGDQDISARDFLISKILPMQGMSKAVTDRKASIGDFIDSVTGEKLGSIDEPIEFIPFHVEKLWLVQEEKNGKMEFAGFEPITPDNEGRKWEETVNGVKTRYDWDYRFYVVLIKDIEAGAPMPKIINFRRTSVKSGKKLFTRMYVLNKQIGGNPASFVMDLKGKLTSNDKGTYVTIDVDTKRKSTNEEVMAALELFKAVKAGEAKIDDSDEKASAPKKEGNYASEDTEF